ncbi:hypothetical protein WA026_014258 [Henosepilachna vigintioctopunctata]|uniref:Glycoside hydrolase 35 catalytic domain-containing protein n=1 Tax=Henosepilachna vigintioctopunctata TaxID=420089 RepID=A0AAW1TTR1_9CUCU
MWKRDKPLNVPSLQIITDLFKSDHMFPTEKTHGFKRLLKFFGPIMIFGFPVVLGNAGHFYITLERKLWREQLNSVVIIFQLLTSISVIVHSFINWENQQEALQRMDRYDFGEPANCRKLSQWFESKIMWTCFVIKAFSYLYVAYHFLDNSYCTNTGLEGDPGYVCGTPMPLWFPFKANYFLVKLLLIFCLLMISAKYVPTLIIIAMTKLIETILMIGRVQDFTNIIKDAGKNHLINRKYLLSYIVRHFEIMDCIQKSNACIGNGLFPMYLFVPFLVSLFIYQIVINEEVMTMMGTIPWQIIILGFYYLRERLNYEGNCLCEAVYDLPWYDLDPKLNKTFQIFLGRLQQPLKMIMKPFTELDLFSIMQSGHPIGACVSDSVRPLEKERENEIGIAVFLYWHMQINIRMHTERERQKKEISILFLFSSVGRHSPTGMPTLAKHMFLGLSPVLHEPEKDFYDFGNGMKDMSLFCDIERYLKIAQEEDLLVIVRPGPYICAQWEVGGMPSYFLRKENLTLRTTDQRFLKRV